MHLIEMEVSPEADFFCPMTGTQIFSRKGFRRSKALTFAYSPNSSEFEVIQPWVKKIWDRLEAAAGEEGDPSEIFDQFLEELKKEPTLVTFVFTASGPWTITNYLCFDFDYGSDEFKERAKENAPKKKKLAKAKKKKAGKKR